MASLPTIAELTTPPSTHGLMRGYLSQLRSYLSGVLGDDGTIATALLTLGALAGSYVAKTAAYTVQIADRGKVIDASGTWTLSLPAVASAGAGFSLVVCNSGSGTITLDGSGAETVDGAATVTLLAGRSALLICSGTAWATLALTGTAGGAMLAIAGTSGAPGIAFATDSDTGLKNPAANQIGIVTGGVQRALLTSALLQLDVPLTGTAAQSSITDATAGRLLKVGAFGLGGLIPLIGDAGVTDNSIVTGIYSFDTALGSTNGPPGVLRGSLFHTRRAVGGGETQLLIVESTSTGVPVGAILSRGRTIAGWSAWQACGAESATNASGRYQRFANGVQKCWGTVTTLTTGEAACTFPAAFSTTTDLRAVVSINSSAGGSLLGARFTNRSVTGMDVSAFNTSNSRVATAVEYSAIGLWY